MAERVNLARDLMIKCWTKAKEQDAIKYPHTDKRVSSRPGWEIHFDGLRVEAAVAQFVGQPELVDWSVQLHGDGGKDFMLLDLGTFQAKGSTYDPPYLRFDKTGSQKFTADFAVLGFVPLAPKEPDPSWLERCGYVDLIGWISRAEFMQRAVEMDFGHGPRLVVKPPLPRPMSSLLGGFVGYDDAGRFLHYCYCGAWGSVSVGSSILHNKLGKWYCPQHHPNRTFSLR